MTSLRVGFIGTGNIGEPMVERLLHAGLSTAVYARRPEVIDRLRTAGADTVERPELLGTQDAVVSCLFTDAQVMEVCPQIIARMGPGSVFVSHTTGSPTSLRALAAQAEDLGVAIVEAPFSGTPDAVREGRLTVLLAGEDRAVANASDVVSAYASNVIRTGELGTALPAKLLNNALFAVCTQLTLTAIEAARSLGISEETLLNVLAVSSGGSSAARYIAASGVGADEYRANLPRYLIKDLRSVEDVASELGAETGPLLAAARLGPMDLFDRDHVDA